MLIANRTSHSTNRWVKLLPDGTAKAYAYLEVPTQDRVGGVRDLDGGSERTIIRANGRVIERDLKFTDEKDLRLQANAWVKRGEVAADANGNVFITGGASGG